MPPSPPPSTLVMLADRALGGGRLAEAIERYKQALATEPRMPDVWFNLAWALRAALEFEAAVAAYGEAIRHGVAAPEEAYLNRAAILLDHLDRAADARDDLERAVAIRLDCVPAWLSLGVVAEDDGDASAARHAYARALRYEPGNGRAHARLGALLIAEGNAGGASAQLDRAAAIAATPTDRAEILFVLGNAHDRLARYDDAFTAYRAANRIMQAHSPLRYDPRGFEASVDRIVAAPPPPPRQTELAEGEQPIFVGGMFRSGSTLAERLLARHPLVVSAGERSAIPALVATVAGDPAAVARASAAEVAGWRRRYRAASPRGRFVIDKRCDNYLHLGLIARLYPSARLLHTRREPLDNLLSIYALDFGPAIRYGHDLAEAAHHYVHYARLMRHWRTVAGDRIVDFDYDRLVRDPGPVLARTAAGLDLPPAGDLAAAADVATPVRTASAWQVRQPINDRSSGRWRHYRRYLTEARAMLAAGGVASGED